MTEEYTLPTDATGRLTFRSWVCTEPNWDGGGVGVSTDGGLTWWLLPPQLNGFHDQISTANSNSPFFGEGIIDGSNVPNGCGASTPRGYDLKTYDLSNLSGQSFKLRFSFFSDTFVEEDGWYIDDAGVEYDVFEPTGSWVSRPISPDPVFGYGWLDGWFDQPAGTTLLFDVLDSQLQPVEGHQNLTLPASLALDALEHPTVHLARSDGHRRQLRDAHGPQSERGANHVHRASTRDEHRSGRHQRSRGRQRPSGRFGPVLDTVAFRTGLSSRWLPVDHRW